MKTGMQSQEMFAELQRQSKVSRDYKFPTSKLEMQILPEIALDEMVEMAGQPRDSTVVLDELMGSLDMASVDPDVRKIPQLILDGNMLFKIGSVAHNQLSERLKIHRKYYMKMLEEAPDLLATNVNHWLQNNVERRMLRTLDGNARAFVSDSYRPLDNMELLVAVSPALLEAHVDIVSCDITETRMYIKAVSPRITAEVTVGDVVQAGIIISNSEVGLGSLKIQPLIYRLSCLNGLIIPDKSLRKVHVGGGAAGVVDEDTNQWIKDDTLRAKDKALFMEVQDTVKGVMTEQLFNGEVEKIRAAAERRITKPVDETVELVSKRFEFNEAQSKLILNNLAQGNEMTQWGMTNAITLMSQDVESYDRATEIEEAGGAVLSMGSRDWNAIAVAS